MNARRINTALWTLAALFASGAVVALIAGAMMPLKLAVPLGADPARAASHQAASALPPLSALEGLWERRLRGGLAVTSTPETVLASAADAPAAPEGVPLTLIGTVGETLAMLRDAAGHVEVRAVGESLAGVEVLQVRPARVQVRYNGEVMTLQKPPETQPQLEGS